MRHKPSPPTPARFDENTISRLSAVQVAPYVCSWSKVSRLTGPLFTGTTQISCAENEKFRVKTINFPSGEKVGRVSKYGCGVVICCCSPVANKIRNIPPDS